MKSDKYYIFCISTIKSSKMFITISSRRYKNGRKYGYDKRSKNFSFWFWLVLSVGQTLKHKIEFIIEINESLAETKIKNENEQLLSKYRHEKIFVSTENRKTNESCHKD